MEDVGSRYVGFRGMRFQSRATRQAIRAEEIDYFEILDVFLQPPHTSPSVRLCACDRPESVLGQLYTPRRWTRGEVTSSSYAESSRVTIAIDDPQGLFFRAHQRFDFSAAEARVSLVPRGLQDREEDVVRIFRGRISRPQFTESAMSAEIISTSALHGSTEGLTRTLGPLCGFTLFRDGCLVDPDRPDLNYEGTATMLSGIDYILDFGLTQGARAWFPGAFWVTKGDGAGLPPAEIRKYTPAHTGPAGGAMPGRIDLAWPFPFPLAGVSYHVRRMCSYTIPDCRDTFDNERRFGGYPTTPRPIIVAGQAAGTLRST